MAITTVTNANLAEYVASRPIPSQVANAVNAEAKSEKTGVVAAVEEKLPNVAPDPGEQKPTAAEAKKEGKKNPIQPRIDELTREKRELEEAFQSEYESKVLAQRRIDELEAQVKALAPRPETPKQELKAPDPKDFTDQAKYDEALKAYQDQIIDARVENKLRAERAREEQEKADALLRERVQQAQKDIPDFADVIKAADRDAVEIPPWAKAAISRWKLGPQVAYHLAKNPDEAREVFSLSPAEGFEALGDIRRKYLKTDEAKTEEAKPSPTTPETTRAPAPLPSLKTSEGTVPQDLSQPMNFKDYKSRRIEEIRRKRH
jgi:hypothetical protein